MRKLYEINSDIERILDEDGLVKVDDENVVDVETGEVFSLVERLENLQIEKAQKIESVALYLDDVLTKTEQIDKKIAYLEGLKKSMTKQVERLHNYLLYATENKGIDTENVSVKVRTSERLIIDNEGEIPSEFMTVKTTESPDKTAIKQAIKNGSEINFAHIQKCYNIKIQ
jgi:hypothetical protein